MPSSAACSGGVHPWCAGASINKGPPRIQIKQIDQAIVREEASMAEVRERILALTPEGMAPEALLLADAARNGGAGSSGAGSRAGRRSKAKGASLPAAPAPLAGAELLAPMAQAVPPHHVPYKFNLPGREPFVVRRCCIATAAARTCCTERARTTCTQPVVHATAEPKR